MIEGIKNKIRKELKLILDELTLKRNEIIDIKTNEEGMPDTQKEVSDKLLSGEKKYSASDITNKRLSSLIILENSFSTKDARFQMSMVDPKKDGKLLLNEVQEYSKEIKKTIKNI